MCLFQTTTYKPTAGSKIRINFGAMKKQQIIVTEKPELTESNNGRSNKAGITQVLRRVYT